MSLTTDKNHPELHEVQPNGQNKSYLILSEEERARGLVRPVRRAYKHVGIKPKYPTRPLTEEELQRHVNCGYVAYEKYPESESPIAGRYWTADQLNGGCGQITTICTELAETYAHDPKFYGATFCCCCQRHLPICEFVWIEDNQVLGE